MAYFFREAAEDDITVDVQVGPEKEIVAEVEEKELNPVEKAKKDPANVCVASKTNEDGVCEYYVDAHDVEKCAHLNEMSMLECLNKVIAANEGSGMTAANIVVVVDESTMGYVRNLEKHGAACMCMNEAGVEDISVDVQVGPEGEEIVAKEDPQEANPVDAVKRQYDNVLVAKDGDNFFMDVEDVQKCADINNESVIATLNGVIAAHEDAGMSAEKVVVVVDENFSFDTLELFDEAHVQYVYEAANPAAASRKKMLKRVAKLLKAFMVENGDQNVKYSTFYIGGDNAEFVKGTGNKLLIGIKGYVKSSVGVDSNGNITVTSNKNEADKWLNMAIKIVKDNKDELINSFNEEFEGKYKCSNAKCVPGRLNTTNVEFTVSEVEEDA